MDTDNSQQFSDIFYCEKCDYIAKRKSDLNKHFNSKKHNDTQNDTLKFLNKCICGKEYKYHSGYYRHKKTCNYEKNLEQKNILSIKDKLTPEINNEFIDENLENNEVLKDLVYKLLTENKELQNTIIKENREQQNTIIKENQELRSQITELIPKIGNNNNNNTTNNVNQRFNINVFLNEKCKDAINLNDFIKTIEISVEQLDFTRKKGLAAGLSNAIMENMNKLNLCERPLHCTDIKRETLYIKDDDKWEKDKSKEKIKEAIKKASCKNYNALKTWKEDNPDFLENDDKQYTFAHIISEIGQPIGKVNEKIIKTLCKETYIKDNID